MRRRLAGLALAGLAVVGLALAGCGTHRSTDPGSLIPGAGAPEDSVPGSGLQVDAGWLAGGSLIAVVTYGSSTPSCLPSLDDVVLDGGVVVVSLEENPEAAKGCDGDLVPQPVLVGTPEGADAAEGIGIQVTLGTAFGETTLDPYTGGPVEDYTPSAGWIDDGVVAFVTWGSSSCAPVVQSAVAQTPTEVVVSFAPQAADQVCTMDMAPRLAVVAVDGEVSRDATLSLGALGAAPGDAGPGAIPIH